MKLIVGLGNPGKKYKDTKHNIGYMVLDSYAAAKKISFKKSIKFVSEIFKSNQAIFLKPKTFMNNSGLSVRKVMEYYHINPEDVLIIFDDLNLPFGKLRLRKNGGSGGHNGIKSIVTHLTTDQFRRLRFGIGRDEKKEMKNDVLNSFSKSEFKMIDDIMISMQNIIDDFVNDENFESIMNKYN